MYVMRSVFILIGSLLLILVLIVLQIKELVTILPSKAKNEFPVLKTSINERSLDAASVEDISRALPPLPSSSLPASLFTIPYSNLREEKSREEGVNVGNDKHTLDEQYPIAVDILSIGSKFLPQLQDVQLSSWSRHSSRRYFFRATERDDPDPNCYRSLSDEAIWTKRAETCKLRNKAHSALQAE
jgi:hypothetical protein